MKKGILKNEVIDYSAIAKNDADFEMPTMKEVCEVTDALKKRREEVCMDGVSLMYDTILIHKEAGTRKDAVRIKRESDIPDFLKNAIEIMNGNLYLQCVEGKEVSELGVVVGYEVSDQTPSGYNCWVIGNAATNLVEKGGVFYKKATVLKAALLSDVIPDFLEGADIRKNDDGSWSIRTSWGVSTGFCGEAYWVLYGINEDGTPDANILTRTEKSFRDYIVCDDMGNDLGSLLELDNIWRSGKRTYILSPQGKRVIVTPSGAKIDR